MDELPGLPAGFSPVRDTTPQRTANAPQGFGPGDQSPATADHTVVHRPTLQEQGRVRKFDTRDPDFMYREDSDWYFAPAGSHLSRWMPVEDEAGDRFLLLVRFKAGGGAGETRIFAYHFPDYASLSNIDDLMRTTSSPGKVLYALVIKAGIPVQ